jgi:hypothetical protein
MKRRDTKAFRTTVFGRPDVTTGLRVPLDLTGASLWFSAKQHYTDTAYVFQKTLASGITIAVPTNGQVLIQLEAVDTADLPNRATKLYWDLQVEDAVSNKETVDSGELWVEPEVTQE